MSLNIARDEHCQVISRLQSGMTVKSAMPDRWIVRVAGKEYGPVDLATLAEWKREGRILPSNEIRREIDTAWTTAATLPELFAPAPGPVAQSPYDQNDSVLLPAE